MLRGLVRTVRYARSWKTGADVSTEETELLRDAIRIPATLMLPRSAPRPLPGWVALGGISCMGRHHPQLVRFARALASSGAAVLVPEVPEWRQLKPAPAVVGPTLRASFQRLRDCPEVSVAPFGLIGFSFGAPQVAIAAGDGRLRDDVAGIVLFGAYCSLERTITCQLTGKHDWDGHEYGLVPDPFGRWVLAGNYLTAVQGFEDARDVAAAMHRLATASSGLRIPAWDSRHDVLIGELRLAVAIKRRWLFDLLASPSGGTRADADEAHHVALLLAAACRRRDPLLDPVPQLARVTLPTRLIHGRGDRLIPFTEGLRLQQCLPQRTCRSLTVTGLFNHSADTVPGDPWSHAREQVKLFEAMRGLINTV